MKERYQSGKMTVNWKNIDYIETEKIGEGFNIYFLYRPKIKTEKLKILKKFNNASEMRSFFYNKSFFQLDKYFINVNNFSIIEEIEYHPNSQKQDIVLYMKNSQPLELTIPIMKWNDFKNSKLL